MSDPEAMIEQFNQTIQKYEVFRGITRDSALQRETIESLSELLALVSDRKQASVDQEDESLANILLGYECSISSLMAELEMYILLKEGRPDEAWDSLIEAQMGCIGAIRAHRGFAQAVHYYNHLLTIEETFFPPQTFISSGFTFGSLECSICGCEYEDCSHLLGYPYMGAFCNVRGKDHLQLDHVAIVESPADKRCRLTAIDVEGQSRNRMTLLLGERESDVDAHSEDQIRAEAILFRL